MVIGYDTYAAWKELQTNQKFLDNVNNPMASQCLLNWIMKLSPNTKMKVAWPTIKEPLNDRTEIYVKMARRLNQPNYSADN